MSRTVLCVDTAERIDDVAAAVDADESLTARTATSVEAAQDVLESESVACVVTAYDLPDGTGLEIVGAVRDIAPQTPCVLFTGAKPDEIDTTSFRESIVEYLNRDLPDAHDRLAFVVNDVIDYSAQASFIRPDDEDKRLETLAEYDVDELPIEASFERLTGLIASHFDAAVSFIGLIEEDRENLLACHGSDWDSLTREDTLCTHSMLEEDVMVVEDLQEDGRFAHIEQLANFGIRSYAGANLVADNGQVIGQVCLLDDEPRSYTATEQAELEDFAATAMEILELRRSVHDPSTQEAAQ